MKQLPIIIIGAGRSGTNLLRDTICRLDGFKTWPCDEINYIWRHGNITKTTDRFTSEDASPKVKQFIKNEFDKFERKSNAKFVVEKTCANSLKIPFINSIFPEAKYLFIVRNGFDVASSAKQRWTAPLEIKYILQKAKFVPILDIPYYALRYFMNRIKKLFSSEKRLAFWGPLYPGMEQDLKEDSLIEVCAKQWKECVEIAHDDLLEIDPDQVYFMTYENFVNEPHIELKKVVAFLGLNFTDEELNKAIGKVSTRSIGKYKKNLTDKEISNVNPIILPVMDSIYNKI